MNYKFVSEIQTQVKKSNYFQSQNVQDSLSYILMMESFILLYF